MHEYKRCTFTINPAIDKSCDETAIWEVHYTHGSGNYQDKVIRCSKHVADTVVYLTGTDSLVYPHYRFNGANRL